MELMQTKIPFLPSDWTVARGGKYAIKLGVFILVPGLHQIACNRRILGWLLFVGYLVAKFVIANQPYFALDGSQYQTGPYYKLLDIVQIFSWTLLALDIKYLETRNLTFRFLLPIVCFFTFQFMPFHSDRLLSIYVEQENYTCPAFCEFDLIKFESAMSDRDKHSVGDFIVIPLGGRRYYVSRILAGPAKKKEPCPDDYFNWIEPRKPDFLCPQGDGGATYDFLIMGGPEPQLKMLDGEEYSLISKFIIGGFKPEKIGNLKEYYFWSDEVTNWLGYALLEIYLWTRINLFGLTKFFAGSTANNDQHGK
jgi:hypothetical protein